MVKQKKQRFEKLLHLSKSSGHITIYVVYKDELRFVESKIMEYTIYVLIFSGLLSCIEAVLENLWNKTLFYGGISIYTKQLQFTKFPPIGELIKTFKSRLTLPIRFNKFSRNKIGFRESFFAFCLFNYTPIMRGTIEIDHISRSIRVIGLINYRSIITLLTAILISASGLFYSEIIALLFSHLRFYFSLLHT